MVIYFINIILKYTINKKYIESKQITEKLLTFKK